jgi:hypothetical protein
MFNHLADDKLCGRTIYGCAGIARRHNRMNGDLCIVNLASHPRLVLLLASMTLA